MGMMLERVKHEETLVTNQIELVYSFLVNKYSALNCYAIWIAKKKKKIASVTCKEFSALLSFKSRRSSHIIEKIKQKNFLFEDFLNNKASILIKTEIRCAEYVQIWQLWNPTFLFIIDLENI